MRERLALYTLASTLVVAVTLSPSVSAQQQTTPTAGDRTSTGQGNMTIHGVIAGITAEGETYYNHQTNTGEKAEAAFLTVVGSTVRPSSAENENRSATTGTERNGQAGARRHDVYIVWLTQKTKVCEASREAGGASENARGSDHAKKEVACDQLEVGDRVEVQFVPQEDSAAHNNIHLSQPMRQKHGRHRTHVGFASAITILPPREHGQAGSRNDGKSNEGSRQ